MISMSNVSSKEPEEQLEEYFPNSLSSDQLDNCPTNLSSIDTQAELDIISINGFSADDISPALFDNRFCMYSILTVPSEILNYISNPNKNLHFSKSLVDFYDVKMRYEDVFGQYNSIEEKAAFTRIFLNRLSKEFAVAPSLDAGGNFDGIAVTVLYKHPGKDGFSAEALYLLGTEKPELANEFERQILKVSGRTATQQIYIDVAYIFNGKKIENKFGEANDRFVILLKSRLIQ
jgi:hypothetical protein